jgi:hypothetical protein
LPRRLFFDLTGLLQWYGFFRHPSGIQRVTEQLLMSAAIASHPDVTYVARAMGSPTFFEVDRDTVSGLCRPQTRPQAIARVRAYLAKSTRLSTLSGLIADSHYFHLPYLAAGYARAETLVEAWFAGAPRRSPLVLTPVAFPAGAVFFNPGDYWCHKTYAAAVCDLKRRSGVRLALLVHDLFAPARRDWSHPVFGPLMAEQFEMLAADIDRWLATSQYVRRSLQEYLAARRLPAEVTALSLGQTRIGGPALPPPERARILAALGVSGGYMLFVGTVEPRKNLPALLDALRALRAELALAEPPLVIVGRDGWKSRP